MTLMTMLEIPVVPVVVPFVDVAHVSDGVGMQAGEGLLHLLVPFAQHLTGSDGVDEELADDGHISCATIASHTMIAFVRLILILR